MEPYDSTIQSANIPDATVIRDNSLREVTLFVTISIGTPAVHNLETIDTVSSLSLFGSMSTL
jgi:hypothetical protein